MTQNPEMLYQKFQTSQQPAVKLDLALSGFFSEDFTQTQKQTFGNYIKLRIRPAVQLLLDREELDQLSVLMQHGWIQKSVLEDCLRYAIERKQIQGFLWLMHYKKENFGFRDRDLSL